jgi:hypothetical protein
VVIPLPVLAVWLQPAELSITSQPAGAEVLLDGQKLNTHTPTRAQVQRDLQTHKIELRKDGFLSTARALRYDRDVDLAIAVTLESAKP